MTTTASRDRTDSARSRSSTGDPIVRGRMWSEDITRGWNRPPTVNETLQTRAERYYSYLTINETQLRHLYNEFIKELETGLAIHRDEPNDPWDIRKCSMKMLDTHVNTIPTGEEKTVAYALDFGGTNLRAVRVKLDGGGKASLTNLKTSLMELAPQYEKGLLDKEAGASELFDAFANQIKELMRKQGDTSKEWAGVGFTFSFPIVQNHLKNANLIHWTKEFETGTGNDDPVIGMDVGLLLDQAFWRNEVAAKTAAVLNDTTGTLLSCAYEKPRNAPPCLIGMILGTGVNGCYWQDEAQQYGYKGSVINTELGCFDKGLPMVDVDLEVDFASPVNRGNQILEKLVSGAYLGEVCRRVIVKVFQKDAPPLAWVRETLPSEAAAEILNDKDLTSTKKVLDLCLDWQPDEEGMKIVKEIVTLVFDRSAGIAAATIAGMAKKTGRLSKAMGGLSVGIDGSLYTRNPWYANRLRHHIDTTLGTEVGKLINLCVATDGSGKGAAILAGALAKKD